jgi:hypothetical protein
MAQYKPMLLSSTFSACPLNGSGVSVVEALGSATGLHAYPALHTHLRSSACLERRVSQSVSPVSAPCPLSGAAVSRPAAGRPRDPSIIGLFLLAKIQNIHFVFHTNSHHIKYTITMGFSEVHTEVPRTAIHLVGTDDWQADLAKNGYAVVKGAVPKERAADYTERMHQYLEG